MSAQPWTVEEAGMGSVGDFKHFWFVEGVILDQSSSSETSVYRDSLGCISSKTYTSQDIWIKTETEGEIRIGLNKAIPLRAGQEAVIVYYRKHIKRSVSCFLYIKNTKELYETNRSPFSCSCLSSIISIVIGIAITFALTMLDSSVSNGKINETILLGGFFISIIGIPIIQGAGRVAKYNNLKDNLVYNYLTKGGDLTVNPPQKA